MGQPGLRGGDGDGGRPGSYTYSRNSYPDEGVLKLFRICPYSPRKICSECDGVKGCDRKDVLGG